jgi:hypothetical protein
LSVYRPLCANADIRHDNLVAKSNSFEGTAIPNAFAVLRLIDNAILIGNASGIQPGGVPRRILSTK